MYFLFDLIFSIFLLLLLFSLSQCFTTFVFFNYFLETIFFLFTGACNQFNSIFRFLFFYFAKFLFSALHPENINKEIEIWEEEEKFK